MVTPDSSSTPSDTERVEDQNRSYPANFTLNQSSKPQRDTTCRSFHLVDYTQLTYKNVLTLQRQTAKISIRTFAFSTPQPWAIQAMWLTIAHLQKPTRHRLHLLRLLRPRNMCAGITPKIQIGPQADNPASIKPEERQGEPKQWQRYNP